MISFISSFEIIKGIVRCDKSNEIVEPRIFLLIPMSAADTGAVNTNGIKMFAANDISTFFIKGNPVFINGSRRLPRNPPYYTVVDI